MLRERKKWPYDFPSSEDFPNAKERGEIKGRLQVYDEYLSSELIPAESAYVGLAPPGEEGSFQDDSKVYINKTSKKIYILYFFLFHLMTILILAGLSILDTSR